MSSFWNIVDISGLLLALIVLIAGGTKHYVFPIQYLRVCAAFASLFTLMKLFDWLRLFEKTGFYVKLVGETLNDIKYFILLLLTTLMMFGVPVVMLDASSDKEKDLIDKVSNLWIFDLIYT